MLRQSIGRKTYRLFSISSISAPFGYLLLQNHEYPISLYANYNVVKEKGVGGV